MDEQDSEIRKFIFDVFLERAAPPVAEEIATRFRLDRVEAVERLRTLESERHLRLVPGTPRILMAFPFSAIATPYRVVRRNGRSYFANCAWDAVAFAPLLDEPIDLRSFCHHCATPVAASATPQRSASDEPDGPRVYLGRSAASWWDDIITTCANEMVLFASEQHLTEWRSAATGRSGESLTIPQTVELSRPFQFGKLGTAYRRPSKEELTAHFARLGLTSPFWRIY